MRFEHHKRTGLGSDAAPVGVLTYDKVILVRNSGASDVDNVNTLLVSGGCTDSAGAYLDGSSVDVTWFVYEELLDHWFQISVPVTLTLSAAELPIPDIAQNRTLFPQVTATAGGGVDAAIYWIPFRKDFAASVGGGGGGTSDATAANQVTQIARETSILAATTANGTAQATAANQLLTTAAVATVTAKLTDDPSTATLQTALATQIAAGVMPTLAITAETLYDVEQGQYVIREANRFGNKTTFKDLNGSDVSSHYAASTEDLHHPSKLVESQIELSNKYLKAIEKRKIESINVLQMTSGVRWYPPPNTIWVQADIQTQTNDRLYVNGVILPKGLTHWEARANFRDYIGDFDLFAGGDVYITFATNN